MANILNNQEITQTLADGLMELSKDNSVSVSLKKANFNNLTLKYIFSLCRFFFFLTSLSLRRHNSSEKLHQVVKTATERFWAQDIRYTK